MGVGIYIYNTCIGAGIYIYISHIYTVMIYSTILTTYLLVTTHNL